MSQPRTSDVIHSLNLAKQGTRDASQPEAGKCGGDCSNCPCSGESPKSTKKKNGQEASDPCDKC